MPSPRKKKNSDQKKKTRGAAQRAKRDLNFIKLNEEAAALDDLWHAAMQSRLRDTKITVDGKISGEHWDAFAGKVLQIAPH